MLMIVDLGLGNVNSVHRALEYIGAPNFISNVPSDLSGADKIVLPGVGSFHEASERLAKTGFQEALTEAVLGQHKPILGICLGMQLLAREGEEGGAAPGLQFVPAKVTRMNSEKHQLRLPHVGWNSIESQTSSLRLMKDLSVGDCFYFTHSYEMVPSSTDNLSVAKTRYGQDFVSIVESGGVCGVQFHPEKSQKSGLRLLRNFVELF